MTNSDIPSLARLRDDLVSGARTANTRRARRRGGALAAAAVAALAAAGFVAAPDPPDALAIEQRGRYFEVRVRDATADPEEMNRQLADAGIRARVVLAPVPPPLVGHWTSVIAAGDERPHELHSDCIAGLRACYVDPGRFDNPENREMRRIRWEGDVLRIPRDLQIDVDLEAGRPARAGEAYVEDFGDVLGEDDS